MPCSVMHQDYIIKGIANKVVASADIIMKKTTTHYSVQWRKSFADVSN